MDADERNGGERRRWLWVVLIALVVTIGTVVGGVALKRRELAESAIESQLRALGIEHVAHRVESVGFSRIRIRDVRVGDDDLVVDEIDIDYSVTGLRRRRIDGLMIRGLKVRGRLDDRGLTFGALDAYLEAGAEDEPGETLQLTLPVNAVSIEDFSISLATPDGSADATGSLSARAPRADTVDLEFEIAATLPQLGSDPPLEVAGRASMVESRVDFDVSAARAEQGLRVNGRGHHDLATGSGEIRFDSDPLEFREGGLQPYALLPQLEGLIGTATGAIEADGSVQWNSEGGIRSGGGVTLREIAMATDLAKFEKLNATIRIGGPPSRSFPMSELSIEGLSVSIATPEIHADATGSIDARILADDVVETDFHLAVDIPQLGRNSPLAIVGKATTVESAIEFEFSAVGSRRELKLSGSGQHDLASGNGEMRFNSDPLDFREGGLQPSTLVPQLEGLIQTATGSVAANGGLHWNSEGEIRGGADLALRELSVMSEDGNVRNLNAAIHVDGPWPPSTPEKQLVSMAQIDFGLQLLNGLIAFQLRRDGLLDISSAEWTLAGGKVLTRGRIDPAATEQALVLELVDIELSELLKLVDLDGLTGSGRLEGRIPLKRRGTTLEIKQGVLSATSAGGWIRYRPDTGIAGVAGQDNDFNIVLGALRNFQFRELSATLDGDTEGPVDVSIHLAGANPDYLSGHPVEFNLNIEAHLVDLLRNATSVYRIPEKIEKRLTEISEGHR